MSLFFPFLAKPCPCGSPSCKNWFVSPVASVQGVSFNEAQATAVAVFLNTHPELWELWQHEIYGVKS
jgi:hypothetical protein